jgi:hypothetical protein
LASFSASNAISMSFAAATTAYSVWIPYAYTTSTGSAACQDPTATLSWQQQTVTGLIYPNSPVKTILVTCTSEAGVGKQYSIDVKRNPSSNAYLGSLTASTGSWSTAFSSTTLSYTLTLVNTDTSVSFGAAVLDPTATITSYAPSSTVSSIAVLPTTYTVTINTKAEDGTTSQNTQNEYIMPEKSK